jgi:mRNA-degrading endonuclease toxin of MazEF toxin-antitoxin module
MPAPDRNHVQVVRCKDRKRCVPISAEAVIGSTTAICPVCLERRAYIVATEVFQGQPNWEVMRTLQGRC